MNPFSYRHTRLILWLPAMLVLSLRSSDARLSDCRDRPCTGPGETEPEIDRHSGQFVAKGGRIRAGAGRHFGLFRRRL